MKQSHGGLTRHYLTKRTFFIWSENTLRMSSREETLDVEKGDEGEDGWLAVVGLVIDEAEGEGVNGAVAMLEVKGKVVVGVQLHAVGEHQRSKGRRQEEAAAPALANAVGGETLHAHPGEAGGEGLQQGVGGVGCGRQQAALNRGQQCNDGATGLVEGHVLVHQQPVS